MITYRVTRQPAIEFGNKASASPGLSALLAPIALIHAVARRLHGFWNALFETVMPHSRQIEAAHGSTHFRNESPPQDGDHSAAEARTPSHEAAETEASGGAESDPNRRHGVGHYAAGGSENHHTANQDNPSLQQPTQAGSSGPAHGSENHHTPNHHNPSTQHATKADSSNSVHGSKNHHTPNHHNPTTQHTTQADSSCPVHDGQEADLLHQAK